MRRRSTYITHPSQPVNPADIQVTARQLLIGGLKAAREERLTLGLNELPDELVEVLQQSHELHVRWAPEAAYNTTAPFLSRTSPGLHVHYTPLHEKQPDLLCNFLKRVFGTELRCDSPESSFIAPDILSDRFAHTASLQYYALVPSLKALVGYLYRSICKPGDLACLHTTSLITIASSLDFSYDSISHTCTLTVFWSKQPEVFYDPVGEFTTLDAWNLDVQALGHEKVEVGLLAASPATDPHDLQLSGFLTVVGEDDHPRATLFSFPSRHHSHRQTYTVAFDKPTGLHPTLRISLPPSIAEPANKPPSSTCALHTYLTLPSHLFPDKYAFLTTDPLFHSSHHTTSLRSIAGELDLEAPDYVIRKWGSTMLLELQTPSPSANDSGESWDVTIPLHFRYLPPQTGNGGLAPASLPWPIVFWACTAEEGTKFPVNPFDRNQLGYEGLFGPRTMFFHLDPAPVATGGKLVEEVTVPVLNTSVLGEGTVEVATVITISLGFLWVIWKLLPALRGGGRAQVKTAKKTQ